MPSHDLSADRLAMRYYMRQQACSHGGAVPVDSLAGERVAWLCPPWPSGCDAQLPPDHWIGQAEQDLAEVITRA